MSMMARCRYEVFCADATPYAVRDAELAAVVSGGVGWERIERAQDEGPFKPPAWGAPGAEQSARFVHPVQGPSRAVTQAIRRSPVCYVIAFELPDAEDHRHLEGAVALALDIASERDGVVVDRTSDIGYTLADLEELVEGLEV